MAGDRADLVEADACDGRHGQRHDDHADAEPADGDRNDQVGEVRDAGVERRAVDHGAQHQHAAGDDEHAGEKVHQLRRGGQPDAQSDHERDEADPARGRCSP